MRTVTTHADMALLARGLGISTWTLLSFVAVPSLVILWSFFARLLPLACRTLFSDRAIEDAFAILMACYFYFVFFGDIGLDDSYGEILSIGSTFVLFPLVTIRCLFTTPRQPDLQAGALNWLEDALHLINLSHARRRDRRRPGRCPGPVGAAGPKPRSLRRSSMGGGMTLTNRGLGPAAPVGSRGRAPGLPPHATALHHAYPHRRAAATTSNIVVPWCGIGPARP